MKIQLDTTAKTIKVEESVNLGEFIEALKKLLPKDKWMQFKLEANTTILNWGNPIIIQPYNYYPWGQPWIAYGTGTTNSADITTFCGGNTATMKEPEAYTLTGGVFNIEI